MGPKNLMLTLDNLVAVVLGSQLHQVHLREAKFTVEGFEGIPDGAVGLTSDGIGSRLQVVLDRAGSLPTSEAFRLPDMPRAAMELQFVLDDAELTQLLDIEPLIILALANQRYCKHSRAEVIMSVLGATQWFDRYLVEHGRGPSEGNLVLGMFPLEFIKEVKSQLGVKFFTSIGSGSEVCPKGVFEMGAGQNPVKVRSIGSMLPFSSSKFQPKRMLPNAFSKFSESHPSALGWELLQDGSVKITAAAILASFRPNLAKKKTSHTQLSQLKARILIHSCEEHFLVQDVVLSAYLGEYSPRFNIYAVILTHGTMSRNYSGVILQEVVVPGGYTSPKVQKVLSGLQGYETSTKLLVRVGTWTLWDLKTTTEADMPSVIDVDQRVL